VLLILSTLFNPTFQNCSLFGIKRIRSVNRRHSFIRVTGDDATVELTGVDITGYDGGLSGITLLQRGLALIQSQFRFASGRVRTMAGETMIGKNRPDVSVEYNLGRLRMEWPQRSQHYDECETDVP
jgi:hypothetical protein